MKLPAILSVVFLVGAIFAAGRGFDLIWQVSLVPLGIAAIGALAGFMPSRPGAAINAALGIVGGLLLWLAAILSLFGAFFSFMGGSPDSPSSVTDATILFVLGALALLSGWLASRRLKRTAAPKP